MKTASVVKFTSIVNYAKRKIGGGAWRPGDRVPSENELSGMFGVSRMTARRALDQLALDGLVVRKRGSGSYIANNGMRSSFLVIRNIADEITESGRQYTNQVLHHRAEPATQEIATVLHIRAGDEVYHSILVHKGDGEALQLENRYVNRHVAPDYLSADLASETPNHVLQRLCPVTQAWQDISAILPNKAQCDFLAIKIGEPCLLITRVTAAHEGLASYARILAPASRYQLTGQLHFSSKIFG